MTEQALLESSMAVIDEAFERGADVMVPLYSGGHDSLTAVKIASTHQKFTGDVYHIDTGIGSFATRRHVEETCDEFGWNLHVFKSETETYEKFVRDRGFPGPGRHAWVYNRIKERAVRKIMKLFPKQKVALITGCRSEESTRRMGSVEPLKIGEETIKDSDYMRNELLFPVTRRIANKRRYWTAPCHNFTQADQAAYMSAEDLPRNPIKESPLAMSGECFCGAFARVDELTMIRRYAPDVATEIDRLAVIAKACGKHHRWGTRPDGKKGVMVVPTGPLCNSCDVRAASAGIVIDRR
jgi:3'-phosphoadenosine 5'-phosphosulfate sulfotransferase (PAPS reductase)/FAD synthetase